ncbi:MAG: glycoside hydrolase family 19 protein [Acetobacteraceae bacterium]
MTALDSLQAPLRAVAPHLSAGALAVWTDALTPPMHSSGIVTPRRVAMFCGQVAVESEGFSVLVENLNYSADRLCQVWPSRFPTLEAAAPYARNPEALADLVYAGRMGNGAASTGDGWRFRGEGLIELTGRELDARFAAECGKSLDDALVWMKTPAGAAASACWFWTMTDHRPTLNALSDSWQISEATRTINGGETDASTRLLLCNRALQALGAK